MGPKIAGYGSKLNHQTTGLSHCFHLPGCHFGYLLWTKSISHRVRAMGHHCLLVSAGESNRSRGFLGGARSEFRSHPQDFSTQSRRRVPQGIFFRVIVDEEDWRTISREALTGSHVGAPVGRFENQKENQNSWGVPIFEKY